MSTSDASTSPTPPRGCHLVELVFRSGFKRKALATSAHSATLPGEATSAIRDAFLLQSSSKHAVPELREIVATQGLSGLAIVLRIGKRRPPTAAPLTVPFEPIELDEGQATLRALCDNPSIADQDTAAMPRPRPWRRVAVRFGVPLAVVLPQVVNGMMQVLIHRKRVVTSIWLVLIASLLAAGVLVWWLSDQWLIIPGGVVTRRRLAGKVGLTLQRYTPADTLLIVRPGPQGWRAELWHPDRHQRRNLTDLECAALLAAWQSPLTAPPLERMSDLR